MVPPQPPLQPSQAPPPLNSAFSLTFYSTPSDVHNAVSSYLRRTRPSGQLLYQSDVDSHIILSHILKLIASDTSAPELSPPPTSPDSDGDDLSPSAPLPVLDSLWIASWNAGTERLEFIVSATHGFLGPHPIFIAPIDEALGSLERDDLNQRMERVASELLFRELGDRVYSIFAPRVLAQAFTTAWNKEADAVPLDDPHLIADLKQCNRRDFRDSQPDSLPAQHRIRRARGADLENVASLCQTYSNTTSNPLPYESARREAKQLIGDKAVYVYEVPKNDGSFQIASMVAVGRSTDRISAITTVHTVEEFRRQGCASRLLRFVCRRIFEDPRKLTAISYVPKGNLAATRSFEHFGFADAPHSEWLESGFEGVELGHW